MTKQATNTDEHVKRALDAVARRDEAIRDADAAMRAAAAALVAEGKTYRAAGEILGVSFQRIGQLVNGK